MFYRKIDFTLMEWLEKSNKALLIDGARQVGKTTAIKNFLRTKADDYVSYNLLEDKNTLDAVNGCSNTESLLLRLSAASRKKFKKGQTIIFIDEIQEAKDAFTIIKYLVKEKSYRLQI